LGYAPSVPSFFRAFPMKRCWILLKTFSASIEMMVSLTLSLILFMGIQQYYLYWFVNVEPSVHSQNETYLIMLYDRFNVLWDLVCKYFIEDFLCSCSSRKLAYHFLFWHGSTWFWY
jgi:hypothetical protein